MQHAIERMELDSEETAARYASDWLRQAMKAANELHVDSRTLLRTLVKMNLNSLDLNAPNPNHAVHAARAGKFVDSLLAELNSSLPRGVNTRVIRGEQADAHFKDVFRTAEIAAQRLRRPAAEKQQYAGAYFVELQQALEKHDERFKELTAREQS